MDELSTWWRLCLAFNFVITILFYALYLNHAFLENLVVSALLVITIAIAAVTSALILSKRLKSTKTAVMAISLVGIAQLITLHIISLFTLLSLLFLFREAPSPSP